MHGECPAATLVSTRGHLLQEARTLVASSNNKSSCPVLRSPPLLSVIPPSRLEVLFPGQC